MEKIEKSILATLAYYDVLSRPLTGWDVFKYLIRPKNEIAVQPPEIIKVLETLENGSLIEELNGFYFLKGRQEIVKERIERQKIADQKWKKARRMIKMFRFIPFLRLVAVSGSLATNNTKDSSDIDLLLVAKTGRVWTCRGLVTLFVHLLRQRRHGSLTKDRFCLNHYLTDQNLIIPYQSLYNAQTYLHLAPLWGGHYQDFQKANSWVNDYAFYPLLKKGHLRTIKPSKIASLIKRALEFALGGKIENLFKRIQQNRIKKDPLTYQAGGRVVFNDEQLEFHPHSPEKNILEDYNKKMKELGLEEMGDQRDSGLNI